MAETPQKRKQYTGVLFIGDPHLEGRQPGFRKDDYPNTILKKVEWCLEYSREHDLLPAFLGDIFDKPRDNPTWMIGRLLEMLGKIPAITIYGNHDCAETQLNEHDSLSILLKSGCLRLVSEASPYRGTMNKRQVIVGGSSYRHKVPYEFSLRRNRRRNLFEEAPLIVWMTHHDISFAGYDAGRIDPHEIENVQLLINGHIHRQLPEVQAGFTRWITPGNISRRSRSDANKEHTPKVLRLDVSETDYELTQIEVPHRSFDDVFHETVLSESTELASSQFVHGLAELTARKTQSGAGLHEFLNENLSAFEPTIAAAIRALANEVTENQSPPSSRDPVNAS